MLSHLFLLPEQTVDRQTSLDCFSFHDLFYCNEIELKPISFRNEPLLVIFSSLLDQLIINASAAQILGADVEIDPYTTP